MTEFPRTTVGGVSAPVTDWHELVYRLLPHQQGER